VSGFEREHWPGACNAPQHYNWRHACQLPLHHKGAHRRQCDWTRQCHDLIWEGEAYNGGNVRHGRSLTPEKYAVQP